MGEKEMTTKERFARMYAHQEADRVPIVDSPWQGTLLRWKKEGMPADADWRDFFGVDKIASIDADISPRYQSKVLEENDEFVISTTSWGVTMKNFKVADSTPEFLDYTVNTPERWEEAKARMKPSRDRVNWDHLKKNYPRWQKEGAWIQAGFWFGFDVLHSWMAGFETVMFAMLEDPEWFKDMVNTYLESDLAAFQMIWDEGYRFDTIFWPDDMGYKGATFFSNDMYRDLLQPYHRRAIDWAHEHGVKAHMHSCGNVMKRVPQLIENGLDALDPIEIKAGMDLKGLKRDYGDKLVLRGGADALYMDKPAVIIPYIEDALPIVKESGGYIFSSDHSIPNTVTLDNYRQIVETVKRVGAY
jgi:uroporphyrinogen decarboxylase